MEAPGSAPPKPRAAACWSPTEARIFNVRRPTWQSPTSAAEEHNRGIVVTLVIPGFIKTDITAHALTGSGDSFGRVLSVYDDAMSADECAQHIMRAAAARKQEAVIGGVETWMIQLKRWFPRTHALVIRSHPVQTRNRMLGSIPILGRRWRTPKS